LPENSLLRENNFSKINLFGKLLINKTDRRRKYQEVIMKKLLSIMLAALLVGSLAFATGANEGGNGSKKNVVVVFIPKISGNAFFEVANEGAQKLAKQVGFTVKYDGSPDAAVANQVNIINNAIQQGADAISISRKTVRIVTENIVVSLIVKIGIMALGTFGIANMWTAVFGDTGVALLAVANSMRVMLWKKRE